MRKLALIAYAAACVSLTAASATVPVAPPAPSAGPSYEQVLGICRSALADALAGREPAQAIQQFNALPENARPLASIVCHSYLQDAQDVRELMIGRGQIVHIDRPIVADRRHQTYAESFI